MTLSELVEYFVKYPLLLTVGKGFLSKRKHATEQDIIEAKKLAKKLLGISQIYPYIRLYKSQKKNFHTTTKKKNKLNILLFDIETAPMRAFVWNRWKQNIYLDLTISESFMLCWSAKWLFDEHTMADCVTPEEAIKGDDMRIVKELWQLFDEADIIVGHNSNNFDIPYVNSRFLLNNLVPPTSYFKVDTFLTAKYVFRFSSNKLDALAGYFGIPHKLDTDFNLWKGCLEGNLESLDYMLKYNIKDTEILEEVYLKLLPYIKGHPNISNVLANDCCVKCGSDKYELIPNKYYYTSANIYPLYRCKECGNVFRGKKALGKPCNMRVVRG